MPVRKLSRRLLRSSRQGWRSLMSNEVLSLSMQCNTTASLRANATRAFLGPARLATANAQPFRSEPLTGRVRIDIGRLVERGSHAAIADLRDATAMIGLARLTLLRRQSEVRPHRARGAEALRRIDGRHKRQRHQEQRPGGRRNQPPEDNQACNLWQSWPGAAQGTRAAA